MPHFEGESYSSEELTRFYSGTYDRIFGYILRRTNNYQLAEDLTSETYLKMVSKIHLYSEKPGKPFIAWLYRIAGNEINMYFRKQNKYRFEELEKHPELKSSDDLELFQQEKDKMETYKLVHSKILYLPETDQEIIALRYFEGKSFGEIAAIINKKESSIRTRLSRVLKKLNIKLQQSGVSSII